MFRCVGIPESSNGISFTSFSSKTVLNCEFKMDSAINKLTSWLFPFIKTVLSISAAVPGFEPEHSWTNTRTRTAAVSKLRKPRKDLERCACLGSALPQPLKKHIQVPRGKINKH